MAFEVFSPTSPRWLEAFSSLSVNDQDIFYSPEYAQAAQATINRDHLVLCASQQSGTSTLLYPFIQRDMNKFVPDGIAKDCIDVVSLYGRGGIVGNSENSSDLIKFHDNFNRYAHANNIICGFDRLHPVIKNHQSISKQSKLYNVGSFVVVDLRRSVDDIFLNFKHRQRKAIRKAIKNSVTVFEESNLDHLDNFLEIYHSTLTRQNASNFYYFEKEFYKSLMRSSSTSFKFFYASLNNKIISCELVLYGGQYCHSFLGGADKKFISLAPNPLLKFEIIKSSKTYGTSFFLLGGGNGPNDGIINYKKSFSPNGCLDSFVCGTIYNPIAYEKIRTNLIAANHQINNNRFQFYDIG